LKAVIAEDQFLLLPCLWWEKKKEETD